MGLQDLLKRFTKGRKEQVGQAFDKAEQVVSDKTGGKADEKVSSVRAKAEEAVTGEAPEQQPQADEAAGKHEGEPKPEHQAGDEGKAGAEHEHKGEGKPEHEGKSEGGEGKAEHKHDGEHRGEHKDN